MSRKDPEKRRKKKRSVLERSRDYLTDHNKWPVDSAAKLAALLSLAAPAIEAAGSIQRALRYGIIGCDEATAKTLEKLVPLSRGGQLKHPDADKDWKVVVDEAVKERGVDMDQLRAHLASLPDPN